MWYIVSLLQLVTSSFWKEKRVDVCIYASPQHCKDRTRRCRSEMNILAAWQRGFTGKNVVVTILDDGIERNHPDLIQNFVCNEVIGFNV